MNEKDLRKAAREHRIFGQFCQTARIQLKPGSIESRKPPEPDVRCVILEQTYYAELVEITDESLARNLNQSLKTGGWVFFTSGPSVQSTRRKVSKSVRDERITHASFGLLRQTISMGLRPELLA
jgi:hypothetical protein